MEVKWDREHAADCPVTKERADLLDRLQSDPGNEYLLGAVPEYQAGGDQEVENCTCGVSGNPGLVVSAGHAEYGAAGESGVVIEEMWPPDDEHGDALFFDDNEEALAAFKAAYPGIPDDGRPDADYAWEHIWRVQGTPEQVEAWFSGLVDELAEPPSGDDTTYDYWPSGVRLAIQVAEVLDSGIPGDHTERLKQAVREGLNEMDPAEVGLDWFLTA